MAVTNNFKLKFIEGSDVVDYNRINNYISTLDGLGTEYVLQCGTKGIWWYRKWSSGRAECGVDDSTFYKSLDLRNGTDWKPFYITGRINPFGAYPFQFSSRPYASVCFNYCTEIASCVVIQSQTISAERAPDFVLAATGPVTLTNVHLSIFCTGRYK